MNRRTFLAAGAGTLVSRVQQNRDLRSRIAGDRHRPLYHIVPPANFLNDPNGPLFWKGKYHMFYQYAPGGDMFSKKYWYHVVSEDLVHWKNLGIAIAPTPGGPDKDGCWTGSAVIHNGVPAIIYTGASFVEENERADRAKGLVPERQMLAVAADPNDRNLIRWNKVPENPVIAEPPQGLKISDWRDPAVWNEADDWYMIIGAGGREANAMLPLYRSRDLRHWEYLHLFAAAKPESTLAAGPGGGRMWECPDFFFLGGKPVLIVNVQNSYFTGSYTNHRFEQAAGGQIDYGLVSAAKTMADGSGRRIWWAWVHEARSAQAARAAGWSGALTLPRILTMRPDGRLGIEPAPELKTLRRRSRQMRNVAIHSAEQLLREMSGDCTEIIAEIELGSAQQGGLCVRCSPDGSEETLIGFDRADNTIFSDSSRSSKESAPVQGAPGRGPVKKGPLQLGAAEHLRLQVYLDASVIEIVANGRACITDRVYPANTRSLGIGLFARGGQARLRSIQLWDLEPISPDRLTSEPVL